MRGKLKEQKTLSNLWHLQFSLYLVLYLVLWLHSPQFLLRMIMLGSHFQSPKRRQAAVLQVKSVAKRCQAWLNQAFNGFSMVFLGKSVNILTRTRGFDHISFPHFFSWNQSSEGVACFTQISGWLESERIIFLKLECDMMPEVSKLVKEVYSIFQ